MAKDGHQTTITFATSSFGANLISLDGPNQTREPIDTSVMGTETSMTFIPADLSDPGEVSCEFEFDAELTPPIQSALETISIAFPVDGTATGFGWTADGFMTSYNPSAAIGERMTASATIKLSGDITVVTAA